MGHNSPFFLDFLYLYELNDDAEPKAFPDELFDCVLKRGKKREIPAINFVVLYVCIDIIIKGLNGMGGNKYEMDYRGSFITSQFGFGIWQRSGNQVVVRRIKLHYKNV